MLFGDLERQLTEARAQEQQVSTEFAKLKEKRDTLADKVALRETVTRAKTSVVEEFKSL